MTRHVPRGVLVPLVVGAVALVLATLSTYITIRDTTGSQPAPASSAGGAGRGEPTGDVSADPAQDLPTRRVVSERGRFAVGVPEDLDASRQGATLHLSSEAKDLVVVVGPAGGDTLRAAEARLLAGMKGEYRRLSVLGSEQVEVDGSPASTVFGTAVNAGGARVRFAVITVHAGSQNYMVASYAAQHSDPATVLPRVNAVVNSFEMLAPSR